MLILAGEGPGPLLSLVSLPVKRGLHLKGLSWFDLKKKKHTEKNLTLLSKNVTTCLFDL